MEPLSESERQEWLRTIYQVRAERFLADNKTIWTTGGIMVPVALAAFVVPIYANVTSVPILLVLAVASLALTFMWIWIAENHRAFQNASMDAMDAIEQDVVGYRAGRKRSDLPRALRWLGGEQAGRWALWVLLALQTLGWIVMIIAIRCGA